MTRLKLELVLAVLLACQVGFADEVRYFLSLEGLADPNDTDSAFMGATNSNDLVGVGDVGVVSTVRFYIWAELLTPGSDLKSVDLAFRTDGDGVLGSVNIWQNNFVPSITKRWYDNGVPGKSFQSDPPAAFAIDESGITNGAFAAFDDQYDAGRGAAVIGWVDVTASVSDIHIIHQRTTFERASSNHRVYLGLDDFVGAPADSGQPYDNPSHEANIGVPEPSTALFLIAALPFVRCRWS